MARVGRRYYGVQVRAKSELRGRRVLITGAARGIGAATARRLQPRGAEVALAGLEPGALAEVAADCGGARRRECDVTRPRGGGGAVERTVERLGGIDVVIANAGVAAAAPLTAATR